MFFAKIRYKITIKSLKGVLFGAIIFALISTYYSVDKVNGAFAFNSFIAQNGQSAEESESNIFIWGTGEYNRYKRKYGITNKLPTKDFLMNNIHDGKWAYGQVYFSEYLNEIGVRNPMHALLDEKVYYVAEQERCQLVLTFLREHYSSTITVKETDLKSGIPVWKFSTG